MRKRNCKRLQHLRSIMPAGIANWELLPGRAPRRHTESYPRSIADCAQSLHRQAKFCNDCMVPSCPASENAWQVSQICRSKCGGVSLRLASTSSASRPVQHGVVPSRTSAPVLQQIESRPSSLELHHVICRTFVHRMLHMPYDAIAMFQAKVVNLCISDDEGSNYRIAMIGVRLICPKCAAIR